MSESFKIYDSQRVFLKILGLILITFFLYFRALNGEFLWLDIENIVHNPLLRSYLGLAQIWNSYGAINYIPLTFTSFFLEYQIWGASPFGYHITNISLHVFNAILLGKILQKLELRDAWLIALIFVIHPIYVESVAWISQRANVLSGFFYLASALSFLRYRDKDLKRYYLLSIICFTFSLFSHPITCTLPLALMLLVYSQEGKVSWKTIQSLFSFILLGALFFFRALSAQCVYLLSNGESFQFSLLERLVISSRALIFYAQKILVPNSLSIIYPQWDLSLNQPLNIFSLYFNTAILLLLIGLFLKGYKWFAIALVFNILTILPNFGFLNLNEFSNSFVADRYQYLASIGVLVLSVELLTGFLKGLLQKIVLIVVLIIFGALTWSQTHVYQNQESFWKNVIETNPKSSIGYDNLGDYFLHRGQISLAIRNYTTAIQLDSSNADSYLNRGKAFFSLRKNEKALSDFNHALKINKNDAIALNNRAGIYQLLGDNKRAIKDLNRSLKLKPDYSSAYYNRGLLYFIEEDLASAEADLNKAIKLNPNYGDAYQVRGNLMFNKMGNASSSCEDWKKACDLEKCVSFVKALEQKLCN